MRGSLGLAAYKALKARGIAPAFSPKSERPEGEVLWLHSAEPGAGRAAIDLATRMARTRDGMTVLLTFPDEATERSNNVTNTREFIIETLPSEHPQSVDAFLNYWSPDAGVWVWGGLRPNLVLACADQNIPMFLVDAGKDGFDRRTDRWLPEVPRQVLTCFEAWLARSEEAHLRLAQLGCPLDQIETVAPLQPIGQTLPINVAEVDEVRGELRGRPIWFARKITRSELPTILSAHRMALKRAHRLLLVLEPSNPEDIDLFRASVAKENLRAMSWSEGEIPSESCSILLADTEDETGLWLSVSPVSFLGRSLSAGAKGTDPYEAAAHGSAILYGPNVGQYLNSYSRLAEVGAARIISDDLSLGNAVSRLIAPDQAASMAMAAWDVITVGAAATDRVIELVNTALDQGRGDALDAST
ncbi:MAG: glycosyltransferase N-terminal domain-containing protein [Paracoccaceae bacterium]